MLVVKTQDSQTSEKQGSKPRQLLQVCCTLRASSLKSFSSKTEKKHVVEVNWTDRWQVYQRLQELDIHCCCQANQPLQVEIENPIAAAQLWSVVRQFTASRQDLICTLEQIWQIRQRNI